MNNKPQPPATESAMQKEQRMFGELFDRLLNALLNRLFDLSPDRAARRMRYLIVLFLLVGVVLTLDSYPVGLWAQRLQEIFWYLFNPTSYAASYTGDPFTKLFNLLITAIIDPHIFQYFPIFLAPFFIALHLAALYLADIFELEDVAVARSFVWEVALTGSDETIRITQGKVAEKHLESPNYLIGGPGKVMVDLDSVALFERADGTSHVIGPTGKEPGGKATIDGFERFRQAIDIRDHHVELRDQDSKSPSVKGRSRDGIPITATDVHLMFSIYRGEHVQPTPETPYPISKEAIERIVYKAVSRVTPDQPNASAYEFSWINNMIGLIRGKLGGFMSERNLTEYLASTGAPEFEKLKQSEESIAAQVRRLTKPSEESQAKAVKPPPSFTPRHKITDLFSQFTDEFTKSARNNGVELHWIGVGTWKTPPEIDIVSEKHLEAWQLSQDNMKTGSPEAMNMAEGKAILDKMSALIQNVPIEAYQNIIDAKRQANKWQPTKKQDRNKQKELDYDDDILFDDDDTIEMLSENLMISDLTKRFNDRITAITDQQKFKGSDKDSEQRDEMRALLLEYRKTLMEAVQFMKAKDESVPPIIEEAIKYIDAQMGFKHWAGSS
ncbi:MAG: hypothetical protein ABI904_04600 [Chloroflexota bacterium]